jgi:hypothetical protein
MLNACWDEFDFKQRVWTIPATPMKAGRRAHRPIVKARVRDPEVAGEAAKGIGLFRGPALERDQQLDHVEKCGLGRVVEIGVEAHCYEVRGRHGHRQVD